VNHSPYFANPTATDQVGLYTATYGAVSDFVSPRIISGLSASTAPAFTFTTPKQGDVVGAELSVLLQGAAAGGDFQGTVRGVYAHADLVNDGNNTTVTSVFGLTADINQGGIITGSNYNITNAVSGYFGLPAVSPGGVITNKYGVFTDGDIGIGGSFAAPKTRLGEFGGIQTQPSAGTAVFALDTAVLGSEITLADDATTNPGGAANNFAGLIIVNSTSTGEVGMFMTGGNATILVSQTAAEFDDADTDNKTCVYLVGGIITLKNRLGSAQTYRVTMLRTRNTN
jgi:hypothetical protein